MIESITDWAFSWPISARAPVSVSIRETDGLGWGEGEREKRTLVVVDDVSEVVASAIVRFAHAHRVVREVDIAVIT